MKQHDILIVDDDPSAIRLLSIVLAGSGRVRFAVDGEAALRLARQSVPDIVLLDAEMPGLSGFEVCAAMKRDPLLAEVPVVFVTSHRNVDFELSGFEHGAVDFIHKPISAPLVRARVRTQLRVKQLHDELRRLSTMDALTGVPNRRHFDETLATEWQRSQRDRRPIALIMVDVDHFKRFNDRHGHPAGDAALQAVAATLSTACQRPADQVSRYGGEEFAVLLPDTPPAGAASVGRRIVAGVAALQIAHGDSPTAAHVTVSVGIGSHGWSCPDDAVAQNAVPGPGAATLLATADRALYLAKQDGRCCVRCLEIGRERAAACSA